MRIFGVILAGGQGRRMGGADKALIRLGGRPLLFHVIERLEPQVERLAISANGDPGRFVRTGLPVLADTAPQGPLSGLLAALDWAAALGGTHVVTAAVDTPFLPDDLVPRLLLAAETSPGGVAVAESDGRLHPTSGLWPVTHADDLRAALAAGEARVQGFANRLGAAPAHFADERAFLNLNTPEDLLCAEAMMRGGPADGETP
ncbi:molybdenum cofactor guanylyltransferase [Tabrizicola sp. J26]|uniref:molybdenum cofactor guanylyltransferase MobA n=1 Tax=Alitabrizicola rongguiensis TaxID=2909234 RepID=UPI001F3044D2|nr:molybdenum cofactor guanylyltransferase MobA [Tabrizicola rongguiensis]MCF1707661.1 molybdenum cofactor guanylyltransferase [Tabrizicola rongguiensis]